MSQNNFDAWIELRTKWNKDRNFISEKGKSYYMNHFIEIGDGLCEDIIKLHETMQKVSKGLEKIEELDKQSAEITERMFSRPVPKIFGGD